MANTWFVKGFQYGQLGDFNAAIEAYGNAVELDPFGEVGRNAQKAINMFCEPSRKGGTGYMWRACYGRVR
ncbi:MAG: tetratricopeptide repeat protein [Deltaproteobacteria bacterium]|nr:tetratricopeptide repeat protein [Deltaproteobacteria bacterium]